MTTLYPQLRLTDPNFNYVPSAKTDIRETFRQARSEMVKKKYLPKPLVKPTLPPGGFVLSADWFEME